MASHKVMGGQDTTVRSNNINKTKCLLWTGHHCELGTGQTTVSKRDHALGITQLLRAGGNTQVKIKADNV